MASRLVSLGLAAPVLFYIGAAALAAVAGLPLVVAAHVLRGAGAAASCAAALAAVFVALHVHALLPRTAVVGSRTLLVVVSGCDSGFGLAVVLALAARGFRVLAGCLTQEGVTGLKGARNVEAFLLDVTSAPSVQALGERVAAARSGGASLFCLVNNAGIGDSGPVDWVSMSTFRRVLDVNFLGVVAVTKALLGALLDDAAAARAAGGPAVRVVNVASIAGILAAPNLSAYAASKFAVEAFSDALRRESAAFGLRVTIVEPSFFATPILDTSGPAFATLDSATKARWGAAWAEAGDRAKAAVTDSAEPCAQGAAVIEAAACDVAPRERVRAGTAGIWLLPYVAALPAWLGDALMSAAAPVGLEPVGVIAARAAHTAEAGLAGASKPQRKRAGSVARGVRKSLKRKP